MWVATFVRHPMRAVKSNRIWVGRWRRWQTKNRKQRCSTFQKPTVSIAARAPIGSWPSSRCFLRWHRGYPPSGTQDRQQAIQLRAAATGEPWLTSAPRNFRAQLTQFQKVIAVPPSALALTRSAQDPHQILRCGSGAVSTHCHPEFVPDITAAIIGFRAGALRGEGQDPEALRAATKAAFDASRP